MKFNAAQYHAERYLLEIVCHSGFYKEVTAPHEFLQHRIKLNSKFNETWIKHKASQVNGELFAVSFLFFFFVFLHFSFRFMYFVFLFFLTW